MKISMIIAEVIAVDSNVARSIGPLIPPLRSDEEGGHDAEGGCFGRRGNAEIHGAEHREDDGQHGQDREQAGEPLRPAACRLASGDPRVDARHDVDREHEQRGHRQPGDHRGEKQFPDRRAGGEDPVDDEIDARRDQDAERAAGCERPEHDAMVVAVGAKRGHRHRSHGRRGRDAGAGARSEDPAGGDVAMEKAAGNRIEPLGERAVHALAHAAAQQQLAHQRE
jgi:hypothetical protein